MLRGRRGAAGGVGSVLGGGDRSGDRNGDFWPHLGVEGAEEAGGAVWDGKEWVGGGPPEVLIQDTEDYWGYNDRLAVMNRRAGPFYFSR